MCIYTQRSRLPAPILLKDVSAAAARPSDAVGRGAGTTLLLPSRLQADWGYQRLSPNLSSLPPSSPQLLMPFLSTCSAVVLTLISPLTCGVPLQPSKEILLPASAPSCPVLRESLAFLPHRVCSHSPCAVRTSSWSHPQGSGLEWDQALG